MTQTKYRPHQTTLERVMDALMGLPRLILLSYTVRKTGRSYTIPVSYVQQGDVLLIP